MEHLMDLMDHMDQSTTQFSPSAHPEKFVKSISTVGWQSVRQHSARLARCHGLLSLKCCTTCPVDNILYSSMSQLKGFSQRSQISILGHGCTIPHCLKDRLHLFWHQLDLSGFHSIQPLSYMYVRMYATGHLLSHLLHNSQRCCLQQSKLCQ